MPLACLGCGIDSGISNGGGLSNTLYCYVSSNSNECVNVSKTSTTVVVLLGTNQLINMRSAPIKAFGYGRVHCTPPLLLRRSRQTVIASVSAATVQEHEVKTEKQYSTPQASSRAYVDSDEELQFPAEHASGSGRRIAVLKATKRGTQPVQERGRSLEAYMRLPASQYRCERFFLGEVAKLGVVKRLLR